MNTANRSAFVRSFLLWILAGLPAFAQVASPWEDTVQRFQVSFTGPIAYGLSLVSIVVGGLMFAFGDGAGKRTVAGIIFGVGMAVGAVRFMNWGF